jgi:predicted branched-subunit amino acid permease
LIWAGPAQVLFFGAIAAKTALPAVALTVCLSSVRFVPMCLSVLPMLRRPGVRMSTMFAASHYIAVTVWAESLRRLPDVPRAARLPFFFGFANACVLMTGAFTLIGYYLIGALPPAFAAGVLFLTPVYFLSTIVRGARVAIDWFAIGFGLVLAPITQAYVGGGLDLLVLGVVGGAGAFFSARAWEFWRRSAA